MKIKDNLKVRNIVDEHVILMPSANGDSSTRVISLNSTSFFLWESLSGKDFEEKDAVDLLCERFEVEREVAVADVSKWVEQLTNLGILE